MKTIIVTGILMLSSLVLAGVTTADNFSSSKHEISMLDGGSLYSGFISVHVDNNLYAIELKKDGSFSALNQRIYDTLQKVIAGQLKLKQIHTFDDQVLIAGDFKYKVIAAVNVSN